MRRNQSDATPTGTIVKLKLQIAHTAVIGLQPRQQSGAIVHVAPDADLFGEVADDFIARVAGDAEETVVSIDDASIDEGTDQNGIRADAKGLGEFFFRQSQRFGRRLGAGDAIGWPDGDQVSTYCSSSLVLRGGQFFQQFFRLPVG